MINVAVAGLWQIPRCSKVALANLMRVLQRVRFSSSTCKRRTPLVGARCVAPIWCADAPLCVDPPAVAVSFRARGSERAF